MTRVIRLWGCLLFGSVGLFMSGCTTVHPWERAALADYTMRPDRDPLALAQPVGDESTPEPRRFGLARVVAQMDGGSLDMAAERRLDVDSTNLEPRAGRLAVRNPAELTSAAQGPQIVVSPRQVEEQVANGGNAEPRPDPPKCRRAGEAALADLRGDADRCTRSRNLGRTHLRCGTPGPPRRHCPTPPR